VDNDTSRYTADELQAWKVAAEQAALTELEGKASRLPSSNLAVEIGYRKVSHTPALYPSRHDYVMTVTVRNDGTDRVGDYHVDLEVPAAVLELERPEVKGLHVADRSSRKMTLLRCAGSELYPGDHYPIVVPYFVNDDIFHDQKNVFQQHVKATVYRSGFSPIVCEKLFDLMQNF
jgi:hypothetical protein